MPSTPTSANRGKVFPGIFTFLALLLLLPRAAPAAPTEAEVFARLGRIQTLAAPFVQLKTLRIFKQPQRSEGRLSFARGGALVWEYTSPQKSTLKVEGGRVTMAWPDLGRSEEFDLDANPAMKGIVESMFLWLRADPNALRKDYDVVYDGDAGDEPTLRLTPRAEGMRKYIASFTFHFGSDRLVHRLVIREPDGDSTDIAFTSQEVIDRP